MTVRADDPAAAHPPVDLASHMTQFRVLGPLEVANGGTALPLAGGKARALLARLLLPRQALHAERFAFVDPSLERSYDFRSPLAADLAAFLETAH